MTKHTILVIDSNKSAAALLEMMLARDGHTVCSASSAAEGIEMAQTQQPNVIILNDQLPMMPVQDICLQLRSDTQTAHIPIILMTARIIADMTTYAETVGAEGVLRKPFQARDIAAMFAQILAS